MAVAPKKQPKLKKPSLVKAFWPQFQRSSLILMALLQVFILLALATLLYVLGLFDGAPLVWASILGVQAVLSVAAAIVMYRFAAYPMTQVLNALTHAAGEPTTTTPPNPNEVQLEKIGFKPVLQTIYSLASTTKKQTASPGADAEVAATSTAVRNHSALESALDAVLCGIVVMNDKREITYANKTAPLTITPEGKRLLSLLFNQNNDLETWWNDCQESTVHAEKTWPRIPDKLPNQEDRRFFDVIASYNKGAEHEMVLVLVDRTHLYKVSEDELDFIAFAAHELRGPITVIRGYLDVLQSELGEQIEADQQELFHRLIVSANRLSGYINNILNTSKYDRRHLRVHLTENSLAAIYDTIRDDMQLRAHAQNRVLTVTIPSDLPAIAADTASLSEVMGNLIDNAIKYSNEGGVITVTGSSKGDTVELAVEDHGIGMPGNVVSNLFQKFYRSHRSRETVAGTGIGLYISKAIVESHGGTISVRSENGHGSTFTISLPTYAMVADKLKASDNGNELLINGEQGWISNHSMFRG